VQKGLALADWLLSGQKQEPLIESQTVLMLPIHIKPCLIGHFITALTLSQQLQVPPRSLCSPKIKAVVIVGPQIKEIIECDEFSKLLNRKEKINGKSFVAVFHGFLGNHKAKNSIQALIKTYAKVE